ncbi:hypothetical protein [Streptomyces sp. FH025]|uniref:hypothetical protein n=1 Tax=Streptomyces sp. FH025 TaxID=2815937 RepID=UPI001A9D0968|nr:hypothetical protein [Streptomyces sp. FH025]MBO1414421.1 hypothetical protein [Streptomyces sp. FH025]
MTTEALSALREQLATLPDDAFTHLQYLAPEIGCVNRCAMCSQFAGSDLWRFTPRGLTGLAHALADEASARGLGIAQGRIHRPGVLFPYLDNDIASYPHLDLYAELARDVLGVKMRMSSVGFSSQSAELTAMHQRLVADYGAVFDGIRFSLTPYATGFIGKAPGTSRDQYTHDLAHALATYRPVLDRIGHGAATAAVELRFAPLVGIADLTDTHIDGHHVLACGPHLLIARQPGRDPIPETRIERLDDRHQPVLDQPGIRYLHVVSDHLQPSTSTVRDALNGVLAVPHTATTVRLHRLSNADGDYYSADPDFHPDGRFTALNLYPTSHTRKVSGYTDATRHFLGALLAHKAARGLGRRDPFPAATAADIDAVLSVLRARAQHLDDIDKAAAAHLRGQVLPMVSVHARALLTAGYPAAAFFSRDFSIDTGQIVNQGRAQQLFRGLAPTNGEPMTLREERGFGQASLSSVRGPIWRITPLPHTSVPLPRGAAGRKNPPTDRPTVLIEEMDPCHLSPVMRATGCKLRRFRLTGVEIEHVPQAAARAALGFPGAR